MGRDQGDDDDDKGDDGVAPHRSADWESEGSRMMVDSCSDRTVGKEQRMKMGKRIRRMRGIGDFANWGSIV